MRRPYLALLAVLIVCLLFMVNKAFVFSFEQTPNRISAPVPESSVSVSSAPVSSVPESSVPVSCRTRTRRTNVLRIGTLLYRCPVDSTPYPGQVSAVEGYGLVIMRLTSPQGVSVQEPKSPQRCGHVKIRFVRVRIDPTNPPLNNMAVRPMVKGGSIESGTHGIVGGKNVQLAKDIKFERSFDFVSARRLATKKLKFRTLPLTLERSVI